MKAGVLVFPGSNCDRDLADAFKKADAQVEMIWHKETALPSGLDVIEVPGGFSFGDYLRCGALAGRSSIMNAVLDHAARGGAVMGICNGFQVLTETGMVPGVLTRNASLKFACRNVDLTVCDTVASPFTSGLAVRQNLTIPIAHNEGNYFAEADELRRIEDNGQVAFRYVAGATFGPANPNGAANDIAGVLSSNGRVMGMMPHPERAMSSEQGGSDGALFMSKVLESLLS